MKNMKQEQKVICDERGCRVVEQEAQQKFYQLPDGSVGDGSDMRAYDRS